MVTESDVDLAPELMADVRMARHRHAVTRIVVVPTVEVARKGVDQMVHRSEVVTIDEARRMNGMVVVIADPADLHTWGMDAGL